MTRFLLLLSLLVTLTNAFAPPVVVNARGGVFQLASTLNNDAESLKKQLLQLGASYDRGYGASTKARKDVEDVIADLEVLNTETDAARGISSGQDSPLSGSWRMIWTTAQDVLVLGASPLTTVGAIYQVFAPPLVTNIIDFIPKVQALLPTSLFPSTLIRAEVTTRASPRTDMPMRVGLNFESVKLKPVEFLGMDVDNLPPLGFDLPQIPGADSESSPGYFDVSYLDDELLIIRQNAPGGLFVLAKTDDSSP
jgi:hypothetical protein